MIEFHNDGMFDILKKQCPKCKGILRGEILPPGMEACSCRMKVVVVPYNKGACYGNILWKGKFEMRAGKFPPNHPVGGGTAVKKDPLEFSTQFGSSSTLDAFRARGYFASCFPEGDGITFSHEDERSVGHVETDVAECFGWEVVKRL